MVLRGEEWEKIQGKAQASKLTQDSSLAPDTIMVTTRPITDPTTIEKGTTSSCMERGLKITTLSSPGEDISSARMTLAWISREMEAH